MSHLNRTKRWWLAACSGNNLIISRYSRDDQVNLESFLQSLPGHRYYLRKASAESSDDFLLVHQTGEQRRLMSLYGNEICLLDATYRTSRYALPLFLVVVPVNVGYQVS